MGVQLGSSLCSNLLTPDVQGIDRYEPTDVGLVADGAVCFHASPKSFAAKGINKQDVEIVIAE